MSQDRPLVSILINNYNYGRYLREAIDSALNQTYPKTEVIVVDDGSTDDSREIIAGYGNRIVTVLKENGGQASAFNAGFAESKGQIVCFLDSDDVWHPCKVEQVVNLAGRCPDPVLIYHKYQPVSAELKPVGKARPAAVFRGWIDDKVRRSGGWWACPPTSALCFRREVLQRIGDIPEKEFRICADAYLSYLVPFLGPVMGLESCLTFYRLHGTNHFSNPLRWEGRSDMSMLRAHLRQYEKFVSTVNEGLARLGVVARLNLKDHFAYQLLKHKLREPGSFSVLRLACQALQFPGDPPPMSRAKHLGKVFLQASGLR